MRKNLPLAVTILSVIFIAFYYFEALDANEYVMTLQNTREKRINKLHQDSIEVDTKHIDFFKISKDYQLDAYYKPHQKPDTTELSYDLESVKQEFLEVGEIDFKSPKGDTFTLKVFQELNNDSGLIVPFGDRTNGEESSEYGRVLALPVNISELTFIDFNLSYNPYTEYSAKYNSLAVPTENQLPFSIKAGEKKYQ